METLTPTYPQPGDRVLCYGFRVGTVVRVVRNWMPYVIVNWDTYPGEDAVYPTYLEALGADA